MSHTTETTEPRTRRWSHEEYYQMADIGFFEGQRVELIDGEVVEMAPQGNFHAMVIGLCHEALARVFASGYWIREQLPLRFLSLNSEPEPDLSVVRGSPRDYATGHPETAALIVEVSESSSTFDQAAKANLYAAAEIDDYWIINLRQRRVEVYRSPAVVPGEKFGCRYASVTLFNPGQTLTPLAAPSAAIAVEDLLP